MGPLKGFKIIELAGIGPGPFCGMLLADMGAEVIVVERASASYTTPDVTRRNKKSIALNLKSKDGLETLLNLVEGADAIFEGYRPGVAERLGVGPEDCKKRNPKIVYGRMTGWGQDGPLSQAAGHDINYISLTGSLYATGRKNDKPVPPLNLVGDYGGGAMFLAVGILAGLLEAQNTGKGQVVDAAMTDGSALLMATFNSFHAMGIWNTQRGNNMLDGGAHFYDTYETQDGKYVSIGSIEPQFYSLLIEKANLDPAVFSDQHNMGKWDEFKEKLETIFKTKTQSEWCDIMEGSDVCFAPVLNFLEAPSHPHNVARQTYIDVEGMTQPAPAPRFSRTPSEVKHGSKQAGVDTEAVLSDWGFPDDKIQKLKKDGAFS
ncbi:carnitine dehydratase [Endozoicomonas sp. OPT23]|uniref:CaiB/BaiF CoA transferase family protein n=1 Tax=Endozoicomonas sp. OPT23 TaxID=2072845 RepID=UPI00129BA1AE|nr:CaiB/BaiF CoA-transferase family protein [Endozoicomonas sp. OPT23]MRI33873.1 carnitine dehydratase [Endozoicomonas sp. OPT23]